MGKKHKRRRKKILILTKPVVPEKLITLSRSIPLNAAQQDRISFSVLRNVKNKLRKIENISYEINIDGNWEWVVRYDDHGGKGSLHKHYRVSLKDNSEVESSTGIKKYKNKDYELTWVCKDIKHNHQTYRSKFLKAQGLDLY